MKIKAKLYKWFLVEAIMCTFPAVTLLIGAIPLVGVGLVEIIWPATSDSRPILIRIEAVLPYIAAIFGLIVLWRYVINVASGGHIRFGLLFFFAVMSGASACGEIYSVAPLSLQALVCAPLLVLIAHLLLLSKHNKRDRSLPS